MACSSQILDADEHETIQIVPYGKTAILKCTSNDRDHNFLFWQTEDNMIGPYNNFDERKYDYEVLSGNLTIKVCDVRGMDGVIDFVCVLRREGCQVANAINSSGGILNSV